MTDTIGDKIKEFAINALHTSGVFPTRIVKEDKLKLLIKSMKPKQTDKRLIRVGSSGDGGYLIPDDIKGVEACFSAGIGNVSEFEVDCANAGMQVFLADKSVKGPRQDHRKFNYIDKYIGSNTSEDFITLDEWVQSYYPGQKADIILQVDIEGYEYEAFINASSELIRNSRIIVVEFHNLHWLFSKPFFEMASSAFDKILKSHSCVHIHPNNCCGKLRVGDVVIPRVMEFTFLHDDRIGFSKPADEFPHALDSKNKNGTSLVLPDLWYDS